MISRTKNSWILFGLFWGAMMFVFMAVLLPVSQDEVLRPGRMVVQFCYWSCGGLMLGWLLKRVNFGANKEREKA